MIFTKLGIKSHTTKFIADLLILGIAPINVFEPLSNSSMYAKYF